MTVAVAEGQAIYQVGDVVLVDALEEGREYRMHLNPEFYDKYIGDGMVSKQPATITKVIIDNDDVVGYNLAEDEKDYVYTDEMFIGKVVAIDDIDNLEEGCVLLVTNDDASGVNPNVLGKLVNFEKVLKRSGEQGKGLMQYLDLEDELISINVDDTGGVGISPEYIYGVVMFPNVELHESLKELQECCDLLVEELGEEEFDKVFDEVATIALLEVLAEASEIEAEKLITAIFGDEIEEGIDICEDCDCGADVTTHAWEEQAIGLTEELDEKESETEVKLDLNVGTHVIETDKLDCNQLVTYNIHVEKIVHQNPATIVFYRTGAYDENENFYVPEDSKLRKCVAKAQNGDVYDAEKGFVICMYKIFNRESARRLKELSK